MYSSSLIKLVWNSRRVWVCWGFRQEIQQSSVGRTSLFAVNDLDESVGDSQTLSDASTRKKAREKRKIGRKKGCAFHGSKFSVQFSYILGLTLRIEGPLKVLEDSKQCTWPLRARIWGNTLSGSNKALPSKFVSFPKLINFVQQMGLNREAISTASSCPSLGRRGRGSPAKDGWNRKCRHCSCYQCCMLWNAIDYWRAFKNAPSIFAERSGGRIESFSYGTSLQHSTTWRIILTWDPSIQIIPKPKDHSQQPSMSRL